MQVELQTIKEQVTLVANRLLEVLNALMDCSAFWELIGELFTEKERCEEAN